MPVLLIGAVASALGCGSKDAAQVSGRAQYKDGSPIEGGVRVIRFEPAEDTTAEIRKAASAPIQPDGSFELFTRKPGDGVYLGKYVVMFTVLTKPMGGESLIPDEYGYSESTPFEVVVEDDTDDLLFELEKKR